MFQSVLENIVIFVLELCTMRQSTGYSILHIKRQYFIYKIIMKCVNIANHYDGISQEPLNQKTYQADDFVLAPVVVVITH
jgi:hypothetical protein